jgi:hypothetical protein
MICFFQLPRGVAKRLDYFRSRFFWQGDNEKKKYQLTKWSVVCHPKIKVVMEFKTLRSKIGPSSVNDCSSY